MTNYIRNTLTLAVAAARNGKPQDFMRHMDTALKENIKNAVDLKRQEFAHNYLKTK
jgi:hypothetical protein